MAFVVVPRRTSSSSADIWLAAFDETPGAMTLAASQAPAVNVGPWTDVPLENQPLRLQTATVTLNGLQPDTRYALVLRQCATVVATATVETLPAELPGPGDRPLTVLLGSCFARRRDGGSVGRAFARLAANTQFRPHLKFLSGDQVYLDDPASEFAVRKHSGGELEQLFLQNYKDTWNDGSEQEGFRSLLGTGANYFTADDHEYWNNYPHAAAYAPWDTWGSGGRATWGRLARNLYRNLQTDVATESFAVGGLSFFVADTRSDRDPDRKTFMKPADFGALTAWIAGLAGPGVLVIGQTLFATRAGGLLDKLKRNVGDWALPDHDQYEDLARALLGSRHSIVVLTGDVHYGRIGRCPIDAADGTEIIEIIASPLSLVSGLAGGKPVKPGDEEPERFPPFEIAGLPRPRIEYEPRFVVSPKDPKHIADHFVTVSFTDLGQSVRVAVKAWEVPDGEPSGDGIDVWTHEIH